MLEGIIFGIISGIYTLGMFFAGYYFAKQEVPKFVKKAAVKPFKTVADVEKEKLDHPPAEYFKRGTH